jgi:hypothetical protein
MQKFDHNIGFWEKRHFFAENCDHNIDPRSLSKFLHLGGKFRTQVFSFVHSQGDQIGRNSAYWVTVYCLESSTNN